MAHADHARTPPPTARLPAPCPPATPLPSLQARTPLVGMFGVDLLPSATLTLALLPSATTTTTTLAHLPLAASQPPASSLGSAAAGAAAELQVGRPAGVCDGATRRTRRRGPVGRLGLQSRAGGGGGEGF